MAIQEKTVFTIVLCAIILALLVVVFFVLPSQPPQNTDKAACEARFIPWCITCEASNWSDNITMPSEILCMQLYNPINIPIHVTNGTFTCSDVKFLCNYYGVNEVPASNNTKNVTENSLLNQTVNNSCVIIEFYGAECPHCANMAPVVAQVENETGVRFTKLEVWHNSTNQQIFQSYKDIIQRDCGGFGVPTFLGLKTNKSVCGENSESDLKSFVASNCGGS